MFAIIQKRPIFSFIIVAVLLQILLIVYYGFNGFFGQDSYEYLSITRSLNQYYSTGIKPEYTVYPIMYPLVCSIVNGVIPDTMFAMQLVSMISLLAAGILLVKIIRLLTPTHEYAGLFTLLFFIASPYALRFGILAMSDMFCIALWLTTFYYSLLFSNHLKQRHLYLAVFFASMCITTRYPAVIMLLLPAWISLKTIIGTKKYLLVVIAIGFILLPLLPDFIIRDRLVFWNISGEGPAFSYDFFAHQFSLSNLFQRNFHNIDGWQHYDTPNIIFGFYQFFHPAFIFCGGIFLILLLSKGMRHAYTIPLLITIMLYTLFIGCNPYQNNRYLLFTLPAVLCCYYLPFQHLINRFSKSARAIYFAAIVIFSLQIFLFSISFRPILAANKNEFKIATFISENEALPVYTMGIDGAISAYNPDISIINLFNTQVNSDSIETGYVVFNLVQFSDQFEGLLPMTNFTRMQESGRMHEMAAFEDGWIVYRID